MNKTNINQPQDTEMLEEYDFSTGVRGKYYQQYQNNNLPQLPGIQFLTDQQNKRTGVFIDLQPHQTLWETVINQYPELENIQFLTDGQGQKIAVILNFQQHLTLWQDIYDRLIADLMD
ncbi:hypothetical protein [Sphaerospermopsis sp. LEGE 08334]|jgi:hypothetical protein|uniref:hypothetical protein n=1 Tax=Sphaerospermopsis sp. LEGE 08334 TaxID=1828651 RepID=UPI00187F72B6|nr:hypothetical protein [Sphaerospermopsis sp. LEGE 08334]MBE9057566.1 hypothetical protein [Sphaerospermopsis sp. LEGE 08334]